MHYSAIKSTLPAEVQLVCVSKYQSVAAMREAYADGARVFGESRAKELLEKREALADLPDVQWHFIGHLQRKQVKYIAPFIDLIHSVDTPQLLEEIERRAAQCGRRIPCLLQLHVAAEETKTGFTIEEAEALLSSPLPARCEHAPLVGVMAMATNTDDESRWRADFQRAAAFFHAQRVAHPAFRWLSMGMSTDYAQALQCGSNMVRIGSAIFE